MGLRLRMAAVVAVGTLALAGCGSGGAGDTTATLELAMVQAPDFAGDSVYICGTRAVAANSIYPCLSALPCTCFQFDQNGQLQAVGGGPARIEELCPSADYPQADWTFDFTIYNNYDCTGDALSGGNNNLACYASQDLFARDFPNQITESLQPGVNVNQVVCLTTVASKTWQFDVCIDLSTPTDVLNAVSVLDCGCTTDGLGGCTCTQDVASLPPECAPSAVDNCAVVCAPPAPSCATPATCGSFPLAPPYCMTLAGSGAGLCVGTDLSCADLLPCTTDFQCPDGGACVVGSCCSTDPVCVPRADFCASP